MSKKIVYVTGCLGFIGQYVVWECLAKGWYVRGVDKITYASNVGALEGMKNHPNFTFEEKDINDLDMLYDCDYVINTAAETHVDNSISDSQVFLKSNVNGVHRLLELIKSKSAKKMPTLLHFSTDEVYGDIEQGSHTENDILKPSNPYAATKAAADMLIMAWSRTYGIPYVIVRPTNNYGIGQYVEKLIPLSIKYLNIEKPVPMHNHGTPRRTWLHVRDTARAVTTIIEAGVTNEIYNISGNYEDSNASVFEKIVNEMSLPGPIEQYVDFGYSRSGQDVRYSIDDSKLRQLGWSQKEDFDQQLSQIVAYHSTRFIW